MDPVEDFLLHFGVKGMKWGVRKARQDNAGRAKGKTASERKIKKLDKKFERQSRSFGAQLDVYNGAAKKMNSIDIARINDKPQYKNVDLNKNPKLQAKYDKEMETAFINRLHESVAEMGTNASGTRKMDIRVNADGTWDVIAKDVKHAAEDGTIRVKLVRDGRGFITRIDFDEDALTQSDIDEVTDEFLEHYGIKGMKWGTRRERGSDGLVKTNGGDKLPVSDDAKKFADTNSRLGKGGNTKTLSNKELQDLVTRMNLEQQFSTLNAKNKKSNPALKFVADTLVSVGKQQAQKVAQEQAGKLIAEMLKKK